MTRRRHWILTAVCVIALLCVLASSALVLREAAIHHYCAGDNCPVCQVIEQARRVFGGALLVLLALGFAVAALRGSQPSGERFAPVVVTLVGRKIRLND